MYLSTKNSQVNKYTGIKETKVQSFNCKTEHRYIEHRYNSTKEHFIKGGGKFTNIRVHNQICTQVHKITSTQVKKYKGIPVYKYRNIQALK